MSTNRKRELLYREKAKTLLDGTSENRALFAIEHANDVDFNATKYPTFFNRNGIKDVTLYAHTYVRIECMIQCNSKFNYCEVVITDRFTMDNERFTLDSANAQDSTSPNNPKYYNAQIRNYSIAQFAIDQQNRTDTDSRINGKKFTNVTLVLSMADFPHFGDIDFQFYDDVNKKDQYSDPAIVQFTNAPTVYLADIYKWRPNLVATGSYPTTGVEDYDNIFTSGFGARLNNVPDSGRTDVLTGNPSYAPFYNDVFSSDRLITNGLCDSSQTPKQSYSGHPVYMIEYVGFVPSSFSSAFGVLQGTQRKPVTFSAVGQDSNGEASAWLISATDFDFNNPKLTDAFPLYMYTRNDVYTAYTAISAVSSTNSEYNTLVSGSIRKFVAHCTAFADRDDKYDDKWFREHTRVIADFALSGVADEWMLDNASAPFEIQYAARKYKIGANTYTPPVFELSWFCSDAIHTYSLLKKGGNKENADDWIQVFSRTNYRSPYETNPEYEATYYYNAILREGDTIYKTISLPRRALYLTEENWPIVDNLPELELDSRGYPIIRFDFKHSSGNVVSDSDDEDFTADTQSTHFKVMSDVIQNGLRFVIFRLSDRNDEDFSDSEADGEFAIIYPYSV